MAKLLSEQLAELSIRAKNAEDAVVAAEKEAHDKVMTRMEQAHAAATAATENRESGDQVRQGHGHQRLECTTSENRRRRPDLEGRNCPAKTRARGRAS